MIAIFFLRTFSNSNTRLVSGQLEIVIKLVCLLGRRDEILFIKVDDEKR